MGDLLDDRFEVVNKLGSGGFGGRVAVPRYETRDDGRAVKILRADHSSTGEGSEGRRPPSKPSPLELLENQVVVPIDEFWIHRPNGSHLSVPRDARPSATT
ncbi:hypothetical protein DL767_009057 [Monosporascus sp. MG133]|nr:hypothetical protein DL767_009057 [Monosporascus sp. MG133]